MISFSPGDVMNDDEVPGGCPPVEPPLVLVGPIVAKLVIIQGVEVSEDVVSGCPFVTAGALVRADSVFFPLGR
jgi:hypothetical protein